MSTSVNIFRNTHSSSSSGGGKEEQTKYVTITENGQSIITPDPGKTLSRVFVTTDVGSEGAIGIGVYYLHPQDRSSEWSRAVSDNNYNFVFPNDVDTRIVVTTDGEEPNSFNKLFTLECEANTFVTAKFLLRLEGKIPGTYTEVESTIYYEYVDQTPIK